MKTFRNISAWVLYRSGLASLARWMLVSKGRFVVEFHGVARKRFHDVPIEVQPALTTLDLHKILHWLKKHFVFLSPEEFFKSDKRGVLLTFDDGYANNFTNVYPLLEEFSTPAVLFISVQHVLNPTDWLPFVRSLIKRYGIREEGISQDLASDLFNGMNQEQLAAISSNHLITIGSHTVSHPFLTHCTEEQIDYELRYSREVLKDITGQSIELFAYPAGDYNEDVARKASSAGYRAAFVEDPKEIGMPLFEIPRIGIYSSSNPYLEVKLSGLHRLPIRNQLLAYSL